MFLDQFFLVSPCRVEEHINKRWPCSIRGTPLSSFVVVVVVVIVVVAIVVVVVVVVVIEEYINKRWLCVCRIRGTPLSSTKPWTGASCKKTNLPWIGLADFPDLVVLSWNTTNETAINIS